MEQNNAIRDYYIVNGRAARMLRATDYFGRPMREILGTKNPGSVEQAAKVCWVENLRVGENDSIEVGQKNGDTTGGVDGHFRDLSCSCALEEYSTANTVGPGNVPPVSPRALRVMIFRRLHPITDLIDDKF